MTMDAVQIFDERARDLPLAGERLERLASGAIWSEGPVWLPDEGALLWSDIPNDRILRWSAEDGMSVWRTGVEFTNGHTLEADGSLLHCSHGLRAVVRTRRSGAGLDEDELVVSHYQGRRLNSPNDIVVKRDGTLWFTDPPYGILSDREGHQADPELRHNYMCSATIPPSVCWKSPATSSRSPTAWHSPPTKASSMYPIRRRRCATMAITTSSLSMSLPGGCWPIHASLPLSSQDCRTDFA